jgi:tetratricopeptide (TPR) repeat protein
MRRLVIAACLSSAIVCFADEPLPGWQPIWKDGFAAAKQQHKLVFVDYFARWCEPCKTMETTVFTNPDVQRHLSEFMLVRIDVDASAIATVHHVFTLPTYVVYDPAERERFRMIGFKAVDLFSAALEDIRRTAPSFLRAADLFDAKQDVDAGFLVGNTYSHIGLTDYARTAYEEARKAADRKGDKRSAQLAETLSAFTFSVEGDPSRAIKLLQKIAARPTDSDTAALIWLTLGNAYRSAKDTKSALDAYKKAQSLAGPDTMAYKQAAAAMSQLQ